MEDDQGKHHVERIYCSRFEFSLTLNLGHLCKQKSAVFADANQRLIIHCSIRANALAAFDLFIRTGKPQVRQARLTI